MNHLALVAVERLSNAPMAISTSVSSIKSAMDSFLTADINDMNSQYDMACDILASSYGVHSTERKPFAFGDGIAIIPIHGLLINRFNSAWGFITGYNYVREMTLLAAADPDVEAIVYDVDSGGGEVAGLSETTDIIVAAGKVKPTFAAIDSMGYSAAYAISAACNKVLLTPSGGAGSIGAVIIHFDISERMASDGVKVSIIRAGENKYEGSEYEPLSDDTLARYQASVDKSRQAFAEFVSERRGISLESVLSTEARCFDADEALSLNLIDDVVNIQTSAYNYIFDGDGGQYASAPLPTEAIPMTEEEMQAAIAAAKEEALAAAADANKKAVEDSRARISAIISAEAATGREALANYFAFNTEMPVESALAALELSPKADAKSAEEDAPVLPFKKAMENTPNPNVPPSAPAVENPQANAVDSIFSALEAATGRKVK